MPELPEVETIARNISPALLGKTILAADLRWKRTLASPSLNPFKRRIVGQKIVAVSRRAKFLVLTLTDSSLVLHLRMSGALLVVLGGYRAEKHDRLLLKLSEDATFVFSDPRKFGRVWLVNEPSSLFSGLGPEPLSDEFTPAWLQEALHARRRQLKPLLLDQHFIAGLGNIYTDEALHMAGLHPLRIASSVTAEQSRRLWKAIQKTLNEGIRRNGASIDWVYRGGSFQNHFRVYGRTGKTCRTCGTRIERLVVGQRGTHYCPNCQKLE
jgi:formamidopyrimidine-DNA glycosylase